MRPVAVVYIVLLLVSLPTPVGAQPASQDLVSRGPILIDGDNDLCNVEDVVDGQDAADGIVNCATADGSAERPYVVSGWDVVWDPTGPCRIDPSPLVCPGLPPCSTSPVPAAVAVCGTRKHVRIENVAVSNAEVTRNQNQGIPAAAILFSNVDNVQLYATSAQAGGIALVIEPGKPVPTLGAQTGQVVVDGFRARSWVERVESSLGGLPIQGIPELSLISVSDTPVFFRRLIVDATLRDVALTANASAAGPLMSLTDSTFENGSATAGLELFGVDVLLERNVFRNLGVAGAAGSAGDAISIHDGNVIIRQNRFELQGDGIELSGAPTGHIRENIFIVPSERRNEQVEVRALMQELSGCTSIRISYNDLPGATVANEDNTCPLDARYNWWDGAPRTSSAAGGGPISSHPPLSRPIGELPVVVLATPIDGTQVHGKVLLTGTTRVSPGFVAERIEASGEESEWVNNRSAPATTSWSLVWDVTGDPLGPISLFVRACAAGDDCGLPTRVDLVVIERPVPPIAVLEATPRVSKVGHMILLDASLSYSPQGRPLTWYRFDLGDGNLTPWQATPTYEVRFAEPGNYPVSAHVLDAQNLANENLPQLVIRIQSDSNDERAGSTPGFSTLMFCAAAVAIATLLGRNRR